MQGRDRGAHLTPDAAKARQLMFECIQEKAGPLLGSIRAYVMRMGLASGEAVREIADEVLQETVVEALAHAENYQARSHPMAWLRGIALNVIRRKLTARTRSEFSLSFLAIHSPEAESEQELLEQMGQTTEYGPEQELENNEQAEELLALVSSEDQQVLTLALLEGFDPGPACGKQYAHLEYVPHEFRCNNGHSCDSKPDCLYTGWQRHLCTATDSGKVLWKKPFSFSPNSNIMLQVKGDVLIAGGPNTNGFATLYRLNEQMALSCGTIRPA